MSARGAAQNAETLSNLVQNMFGIRRKLRMGSINFLTCNRSALRARRRRGGSHRN